VNLIDIQYVVRNAFLTDCIHYFDWANDTQVRKHSNNTELIQWENHKEWFKKSVNDPQKRMFVFVEKELPHTPMGQVRFELADDSWWLSYSIGANYRGKGLAKKIITDAVANLQQTNHPTKIKAQVKPDNLISNKVFTGLGWVKTNDIYELKGEEL
jgi:UDP-2,4-diacetamido-2,4,6-trideoxy-beta-L-altropyranose hydrolase